jgi:hypothetical protein
VVYNLLNAKVLYGHVQRSACLQPVDRAAV